MTPTEATAMNLTPSSPRSLPSRPVCISPLAKSTAWPSAREPAHPTYLPVPDITPCPPPDWAPTVDFLVNLARSPVAPPTWWKTHGHYRASIEIRTESSLRSLDDGVVEELGEAAPLSFRLVLAGTGYLCLPGDPPRQLGPGTGFFSGADAHLAKLAPGCTCLRIDVLHPYLKTRLTQQASAAGPVAYVRPNDALTTTAMRLGRGAFRKDFRDPFDAEVALFDFAVAFDRWGQRAADGIRQAESLMDDVRTHVLAHLPVAIEVDALAGKFGMSRSRFSQLFRISTGHTPAHFATEVRIQKVEHLLLDTREPLKSIAADCGFANANHLCKVFRRFRHVTPTAFRKSLGPARVAAGAQVPITDER